MTGGAGGEERKHVKSSKKKKREPMDRQKVKRIKSRLFLNIKKQMESNLRAQFGTICTT